MRLPDKRVERPPQVAHDSPVPALLFPHVVQRSSAPTTESVSKGRGPPRIRDAHIEANWATNRAAEQGTIQALFAPSSSDPEAPKSGHAPLRTTPRFNANAQEGVLQAIVTPANPTIRLARESADARISYGASPHPAIGARAPPPLDRPRPEGQTPPQAQSRGIGGVRHVREHVLAWLVQPETALGTNARKGPSPSNRFGMRSGRRNRKEALATLAQLDSTSEAVLQEGGRAVKERGSRQDRPCVGLRCQVRGQERSEVLVGRGRAPHGRKSSGEASPEIQDVGNQIPQDLGQHKRAANKWHRGSLRLPKRVRQGTAASRTHCSQQRGKDGKRVQNAPEGAHAGRRAQEGELTECEAAPPQGGGNLPAVRPPLPWPDLGPSPSPLPDRSVKIPGGGLPDTPGATPRRMDEGGMHARAHEELLVLERLKRIDGGK